MSKAAWVVVTGFLGTVGAILLYTQITIFVVPPIGAVPEGRTLILFRYNITEEGDMVRLNSQFIDTADAMCMRNLGYVNLLCRGVTLGAVAKNSTILFRLPYSSTLHRIAEM